VSYSPSFGLGIGEIAAEGGNGFVPPPLERERKGRGKGRKGEKIFFLHIPVGELGRKEKGRGEGSRPPI